MGASNKTQSTKGLLILALLYTAASLLHFIHNAAFIDEYPNMPDWLSSARVMGAWLLIAVVGLAGYLLLRSRWKIAGLLVFAVYGALGLDGLGHYILAPVSAHSPMMNLTIWLEALTGALVMIAVSILIIRQLKPAI